MADGSGGGARRTDGKRARELNDVIRYTMWSVFRVARPLGDVDRAPLVAEVEALADQLGAKDVVVRGWYDVAGLRADADLMVWWHGAEAPDVQDAYQRFRRTSLGRACDRRARAASLRVDGVLRAGGAARRRSVARRASARSMRRAG